MKRVTAILFLLVLLFNFYGYRLLISSMKEKSIVAIEAKVDKKEYSDDQLISIKTALHLPYYTASAEFERAYGSITIDGKEYEYVKRRVQNDTLEVLCIPNHDKTKLATVGNEIAKSSADGQTAPTKKTATTLKISLPDFCQHTASYSVLIAINYKQAYRLLDTYFSSADYSLQQERPPQTV